MVPRSRCALPGRGKDGRLSPDPAERTDGTKPRPWRLVFLFAGVALACSADRQFVRSHAAAYGVRKVLLVVAAAADPVDAARGFEFHADYPPPLRPETALPVEGAAGSAVSVGLRQELSAVLAAKGYEPVAPGSTFATIAGAMEAASRGGADGLLAVLYAPVRRWPVSKSTGTARASRFADTPVETGTYESAVFEGMMLLPTAALFEARSGLRLWSRTGLGAPAGGRLSPASALSEMAYIRAANQAPDPAREALEASRRTATLYFAEIPAAGAGRTPEAKTVSRWRSEARVDRFRDATYLFLAIGYQRAEEAVGLRARLAQDAPWEPVNPELVGASGAGGAEIELAVFHRDWLVGASLAGLSRSARSSITFLREGEPDQPYATSLTLEGSLRLEAVFSLRRAFVVCPGFLVALGLEARAARLQLFAEPSDIVDGERLTIGAGAVLEARVMWRRLFAGPLISAGAQLDSGDAQAYLRWGVRGGWRF